MGQKKTCEIYKQAKIDIISSACIQKYLNSKENT